MFDLDDVTKSYAGRPALRPTTGRIETGRTTVVIGPSGCGKSTLLRLLIGLIQPDSGSVAFDGQPVAGPAVRQLRHRMGYVLQDGGLFPHLTARHNVTLLARHLGRDRSAIAVRVAALADLTHFPLDAVDRYPHQLSGGQRQRVGLMRALMLDPDALLLDEPLGSLDPFVRAELQNDLRDIFRSLEKTVVLVTHDLAEAAFFADHMVLMRDGDIVQQGTLAQLWHHPVDPFVTRFIQAQRGLRVPENVA